MPIKRRLSEAERLKKALPKGWRSTLAHPLMQKITHNKTFDPTPKNVIKAIKLTKSWKGASYTEKLFVMILDLLMEKAYGRGVLDPDTYNRLQDHMESNQGKIQAESYGIWMTWCWDYYHDHYGLQNVEDGTLVLPSTVNVRKVKPKMKLKRRKLKRHKE
jgi:hypothetical protein